jgi:hypothetical protein
MILCLVDSVGHLYTDDGTGSSYASLASTAGVRQAVCWTFQLDLEYRRVMKAAAPGELPPGDPVAERAALEFLERCVATPEAVMAFARGHRLQKAELAKLVIPQKRAAYLEACAAMERRITGACRDRRDPCLEDGCAFEENGEACLNAVLSSSDRTRLGWVDLWIDLFKDVANRIETWR